MKIKLILGLGNPGGEYEKTYHSAGNLFIGYIYEKYGADPVKPGKPGHGASWKDENFFAYAKTEINDSKIIIAKSKTFMNESGKAVKEIAKKFNLKPEQIAIAHDDSDIKLGEFKLSFGRSSAGHKGVESSIKALKTKDIWRIRIGIRSGKGKALDFVLKKITKPTEGKLKDVFKEIAISLSQHI